MKRSKLERVANYLRSLLAPGSHEGLDMAAGTTSSAKVLLSLTGLAGSWQGKTMKDISRQMIKFNYNYLPWISRVPFPVGALRASWSKVMISPENNNFDTGCRIVLSTRTNWT